MLRQTLRKFGRYLVSVTTEAHQEAVSGPSRRVETPMQFGARANRLAHTHSSGNRLLAGSIEILGMAEIKRELGPVWDTKADAVRSLLEAAIERHLDPDDTYARREDDESYVLCFATSDRAQAKSRLQAVTEDIRWSLSEFDAADKLRITHDVAEIEFPDLEDESLLDVIAGSLKRVRTEAESAARKWRQHLIRNASVNYKPIWSARRKTVAIHRAVLDDETGRRAIERLTTLSSSEELRDILFEIDGLILGRATAALHDLINGGGQTQLIIPLYYNSVESKTRLAQYLELCRTIPAAYRRYLLFELHDIPAGTPNGRISELAVALGKYAHGVLCEVDFKDGIVPGAFGIAGIVTRVPEQWDRRPDFVAHLERLALSAQAARLKSFLYGIESETSAGAAATANYDYLQGTAIAKPTRELRAYYKLKLELSL